METLQRRRERGYLSSVSFKYEDLSANIREVEGEWKVMSPKCLSDCS